MQTCIYPSHFFAISTIAEDWSNCDFAPTPYTFWRFSRFAKRFVWDEFNRPASLTSAGIIALIFTDQLWIKIGSALLSFITLFVSAFFKSFELPQIGKRNKETANKLISVRDELELLILKLKTEAASTPDILAKYEELVRKADEIYLAAPNTTPKAVERARQALNIQNDNTYTDDEIDSLLPAELREDNNHNGK